MAKKTNTQIKQEVNEALLSDLLSLYSHAEEAMLSKVAKRVAKGITEEGWNEFKAADTSELRKEISALLHSPTKTAKTKMGKSILKAYKEGVNGVEKEAGKPLTAMSDLNVPLSIQNLLLSNYQLIDDSNSKILRKIDDAYREMAMEASAMTLAGVETRMQASQRMMDKLAAKGITTFTDKAGRQWDMASYTEMAVRTATAHAALQGRIDTQESLGNDLMIVSSIGATCPICARWQGVVLSISGKTPGYYTVDQAKAAGLFHPNCKHTMTMWDVDLDGEGQRELNSDAAVENVVKTYDLTQQQRANERMIRHWKRRAAGAITPAAKAKYNDKATQWTLKNIMFCDQHGLVRQRAREGVRNPNSANAQFIDWFGKHLGGYSEYEMAKVILDEATLKQMLKDKTETLTSLYKKYLGDNPSQDYKSVGDTQLTYAQWLKAKVMELTQDMPDPQEEQYITIPAKFTEAELKALLKQKSLTEVYKEHISGSPSQDYKNNYTGPLTYAQWLKAQVGDLTLEKVVPVSSMPQNQTEIGVAKGTKPLGDKPLDGATKEIYNKVFVDLEYEAEIKGALATSPTNVILGAFWADESMASEMDKKGQAAVIKNAKIYFNPHKQGMIDENTMLHELGHVMSHYGLKATTKDFEDAADALVDELGFLTFKDMAFKLTSYATTNAQEFFAEAFMLYHSSQYNKYPGDTKIVIAEAMKKMYLKQKVQAPQPAPAKQQVDFSKWAKGTHEVIKLLHDDYGMTAAKSMTGGFLYAMGYEEMLTGTVDAQTALLEHFMDDDEMFEAFIQFKAKIKPLAYKHGHSGYQYAIDNPDVVFDPAFIEEIQKKSPKFKGLAASKPAAPPAPAKATSPKKVKPKDLVTDTDKENFAKAKQMWDDKLAKDGKMGFGTLKTSIAQVYGLDISNTSDEINFAPLWAEFKKITKDKGKTFDAIVEKATKLFDGGEIEKFLELNPDHPIAKAKAQEQAEKDAIAKAKAEAKAQAQAQAMAAAVQAAKGASGYKLGVGSLTEQEQASFIQEHKDKHLYGGSTEGKALSSRLKSAQKKHMKEHLGITSPSKSAARDAESEIARALRTGDNAALEKIGPLWALHDYSKASGVYNWFKRGANRGRGVSTSDHPLGRGMSEWEYGETFAPLIDKYFQDMPGLEEDVYVHRVFGEDALQNLFGIETNKAKSAIELSDALAYAKKHPGESLIRDKGYLSTSLFTEGDWNGNCEIRIKLNKGTKAAYLGGVEAHSVDEMLVQANQKMRVNAVYERADYSDSEWRTLAQEKGFNPSKKIAIFAETVLDDEASLIRESKEIQIGEMLAAQSGSSNTSGYDYAAKKVTESELRDEFNQGSKSWTASERSGVKSYSGADYGWMNKTLRGALAESQLDSSDRNKIKHTKSALDKVRTTKDRVYRRGSDFQSLLGILGEDQMTEDEFIKLLTQDPDAFNSGTRIGWDDGFLSTSPFIDGGFSRKVEYRIFAPAGTKAIYMAPVSQHSGEEETLFQAGTEFRVIGVHVTRDLSDEEKRAKLLNKGYAQGSTFVVYLEALPDD